ncbi:MAG TPA: hypothetical protein VG713_09225 [Pirellulales bacterium]|nr:hypothetical protein [Pirellulales bacterium]
MRLMVYLGIVFVAATARGDIQPAFFDLTEIGDPATLDTTVLQDWRPLPKLPGVKQKLIEITVCQWWPGQKVRLPVTLCAPDSTEPCTNVLLTNMGLAAKPATPTGAVAELLTKHGVGVVMVGMGTIDAMQPVGQLHLGMKRQLLASKDARFTPAWIWGMSDMRGLTAAIAERDVFRPTKVLATGGSKRGVGAAASGLHDDRFTAILPVVAPILGNPGGAYVRGSELLDVAAMNTAFLEHLPAELPATAKQALVEREQRRIDQSISRDEALAAGWTEAEMLEMNDEAWNPCRIAAQLDNVRGRGLEFFYHVGTNDNVCPALRQLGQEHPDFPLYILPGGQHGGPKSAGFTLQTPTQPEADENLLAFARHHFFNDRPLPRTPTITSQLITTKLLVTVTFAGEVLPQRNTISWCFDRHPAYTYAYEYDRWQSMPLTVSGDASFSAEIEVPWSVRSVDMVSTHTHVGNDIPLHFSSPYHRAAR